MHPLAQLDQRHLWHPFTQMKDWLESEPIVIAAGKGSVLRDVRGREYLDANSSIWTNLHGHGHPKINAAIVAQLKKIAHSSALGLANEPASLLGAALVRAANALPGAKTAGKTLRARPRTRVVAERLSGPALARVFFSDDGSTAMEVALKLGYEFARRTGRGSRPKFLSLDNAYHGDTLGAASLGHIDLFRKSFAGLLFRSDRVPAPYCYRCPFNRARPERADAREYRKCGWECVGSVERQFAAQRRRGRPYAAFVFEPLMQGAAGMIAQPRGWLRQVAGIARADGAQLIADEVLTGFGRSGRGENALMEQGPDDSRPRAASLFACHQENVQPDLMALAKGLTGGYLPMAATVTSEAIFDAFLGEYGEFKTFFHGHSYTANQLGAAAALASLELLETRSSLGARDRLERALRTSLKSIWDLPSVGDVRQVGLMAGIELVKNWRTREPFALAERAGMRVCEAMARRGVLTRPIGNVIVLMPPYGTSEAQVSAMVQALREAVGELFGDGPIGRRRRPALPLSATEEKRRRSTD